MLFAAVRNSTLRIKVDNSHKMPSLIFSEKCTHKNQNDSAAAVISALRVKCHLLIIIISSKVKANKRC